MALYNNVFFSLLEFQSIPSDFAKKFLTKQTGNLTLCNSAGKTWTAMYFRNSGNKILKAQLYGGWREFVEDNHLGVGDMCVFELIKHPEILMKSIPEEFADRYLKNSGEIILRVPDGRTWTVEYGRITTDERQRAVFGRSSWGAFVIGNELKEGDVCILEQIKDNDLNIQNPAILCSQVGISNINCGMPSKENNDSMFKPKTPHFFKIVLEDTIRDKKLGIPRKFVKKYGNGLSDSVLLMVPSGDTWHVELTKSDGVVWLQNGWEEFVAFYSLKNGHFLVFKYEGNDKFIVLIFDMSASEIEYPCKSYIEDYQSGEQVCLKPVKEESKDDTCGEITHKTPPSKETRKRRSQPSCSKPRKKQQTNKKDNDIASRFSSIDPYTSNEEDNDSFLNFFNDVSVSRKSKEKSNSPCPLGNLNEVENSPGQVGQVDAEGSVQAFGCLRHLTATEKVHAIEIANAFKSNGNPVFMVVMRPSFVCNRYRMCIPLDFAKRFLTKHTGNLTLCNLAGKTWTAMYFRNSGNKILKAQLYGGWREFVEDNHLGVGDMCVFELIKHPEILMKVMVYSIVENASKSYGQPTHGSTTNRVKTRSLVSDTEPTCQQSPCPSSSRKFKVPTDAYIEILDDSPLNQKTKKKLKSPSTPTEKQRACMGASNFRTSNPSFSVVMHTEYVSSCTHLIVREASTPIPSPFSLGWKFRWPHHRHNRRQKPCRPLPPVAVSIEYFFSVILFLAFLQSVPYKFVKSYLDEEKDEAVLQVADGRTWIVKFAVKVVTAGQHKAEFSNWRTFAQDNNLNVKDVCVFELINRHENSFKVSIFSASPGANTSLLQKADDVKAIEADDDFGNCSTGNSSPAAKLATIGCQENEEEVNHTNDAIASQVASKGCLVPNIEADDDFGNCSAEHRSPAAELTTIGYQEDRGQVNPTDAAKASQVASEGCLVPKTEADDFGGSAGNSSPAAQLTTIGGNQENQEEINPADYAKASQVASEGSLVPKTEADGDFGNCSAGNSCPAAQLTATGYQENQEQINPTVDAGAIQVSSKDCLVPIIDATADIGNFYAGNSIPASQFTVIGYQETEEEVKPSISTWPKDPRAEHTKGKSHQSQASGTLKALQRACDFKSLNPFFIITMQPSYVCNEYRLAIPLHFSRKYLTNESGDVILFVPPNGKAWLTVYRREATESNPRAKLIDGWKPFVEDNNLEIGDVCVFEMSDLKRYELLLNVVIYKAEKR
ncbi:hypothetical protein F3Y22_tig00012493pilonHSYRG00050 [Hibiscus syriacus]|uniref:TF-B3 domain-containing protein n=1 Tax=Hibiscus syriacus TaxID=106335 RepID=A0A6A3C879_HIBSY|nr:hypothetical protein F3Y22_tig00012493pilonHSYRG00050 [Hibiscus syriacus]